MLRAVAGLWTQGKGVVKRPPLSDIFFLPQRPYMLLGSLRDQLVYPRLENDVSEDALREVLRTVRLEDLPERVGGFESDIRVLDPGEFEAETSEPLSRDAWVQWRATLDLPDGVSFIEVRATNGLGETQPERRTPVAPDGATGWHTIRVFT